MAMAIGYGWGRIKRASSKMGMILSPIIYRLSLMVVPQYNNSYARLVQPKKKLIPCSDPTVPRIYGPPFEYQNLN